MEFNTKHHEDVVLNYDGSLIVFTKAPAVEGNAHTSKYKIFEIDKPPKLTDNEIITVILPTINHG